MCRTRCTRCFSRDIQAEGAVATIDPAELESRWRALWVRLGVAAERTPAIEPLLQAYHTGDRHYHTLRHILHCLKELDAMGGIPLGRCRRIGHLVSRRRIRPQTPGQRTTIDGNGDRGARAAGLTTALVQHRLRIDPPNAAHRTAQPARMRRFSSTSTYLFSANRPRPSPHTNTPSARNMPISTSRHSESDERRYYVTFSTDR